MLELTKIKKMYPAGDGEVHALKGIDLTFRKSEFVSILGPSGCGKTTLLNLIGGLDQYTEGDLVINGKSTKDFKDRDWDAYRNNSVGFVFQTYNLIPHQTVLRNVELALTLSGVGKAERKERAIKALEEVGLGDQINKRPNQLSGGQMQRVAIARALVNNPDIILADEPTGALDTETSVQVMEILKKISSERLIVMVTHNPDLANQYSTRIINMLDGLITNDSDPLSEAEKIKEQKNAQHKRENTPTAKKPSMSFGTSFMLSLKNLFTKKGRTILTSFAGSIGILGIALIFAVSNGMSTYIAITQESALSSYPLSIQATSTDIMSLMSTFLNIQNKDVTHEKDAVYEKAAIYDIINALSNLEEIENDLTSFKAYLEDEIQKEDSELSQAISGVQYSYDLDMLVYTKSPDGTILRSDTRTLLSKIISDYMGMNMASGESATPRPMLSMGAMGGMGLMSSGSLWQEMLPGNDGKPINDLLTNQYDVIYGSWANDYNEIILVVDENNELDDMALFALGLLPLEEIDAILEAAINETTISKELSNWSYEEICGMEFKTILTADCYSYDESTGLYTDLRETDAGLRYLYDNGLSLKVTGIVRQKEDIETTLLSGSIGYTADLTKYVIEKAEGAPSIAAQKAAADTDIFTGLPFKALSGNLSDAEKEIELRSYILSFDEAKKAETYVKIMSIPPKEFVEEQLSATMMTMTREDMEGMMIQNMSEQTSVSADEIKAYLSSMSDDDMRNIFVEMLTEQIKMQYAEQTKAQMSEMTVAQLSYAMDAALETYTTEQCAIYYDEILEFSNTSYEENLIKMGSINLNIPKAVNIYASTFANKDIITNAISSYNSTVDDLQKIHYTDYVGLMMSSITLIIDALTYVLVAFVAISLIVSSIMIGVITLISVQERTKEIGILRAIGASKRDVSSMFNAETIIIGFTSGLIGILVTYILCIPINMIAHYLTGINGLSAILPVPIAGILLLISMALTLLSGIIPSRSAAKKDPVVALRTE